MKRYKMINIIATVKDVEKEFGLKFYGIGDVILYEIIADGTKIDAFYSDMFLDDSKIRNYLQFDLSITGPFHKESYLK